VWENIQREKVPVIPLYFDDGTGHRYRSHGCAPCTFPIQSTARTVDDIVTERKAKKVPELSYSYVYKFHPVMEQRLSQGGIRLAAYLNALFSQPQPLPVK